MSTFGFQNFQFRDLWSLDYSQDQPLEYTEEQQEQIQELQIKGQKLERQILEFYDVGFLKSENIETNIDFSHFEENKDIANNWMVRKNLKFEEKSLIHTIYTQKTENQQQKIDDSQTSEDQNNKIRIQSVENSSEQIFQNDKPNILFLHGYWSSSLAFVKLIKPLQDKFNIYLIDLPGQGLSSRVPFNQEQNEDMIEYFVENIEGLRKKLFQDQKIYLAGHSFGGFVAGHYATKYEKNLEQLYLLSPFGIMDDADKKVEPNSNVIFYAFREQSEEFKQVVYQLFSKLWTYKTAVSDLYQLTMFPGKKLLENYLSASFSKDSREYDLYFQYYDIIMQMPVSSERCMTTLLKFPSFTAKNPLEQKMQKLNIPVHFYFGDNDWMENQAAENLVKSKKIKNSSYHTIKNSGHNLQFENYQDLAESMIQMGELHNNTKKLELFQQQQQIQEIQFQKYWNNFNDRVISLGGFE